MCLHESGEEPLTQQLFFNSSFNMEKIMKGEIISKEFQKMVWVQDKDGKEYACYIDDLKQIKKKEDLTEDEKAKCLDLSEVLGDSW
ncbi:hypothetical protein SAMN02745220_00464 [Desulfopila aestuarii DSM 18488]|uniref:Uncharacterized protein n=2 Tax=Desulfopila aestuarii TaxID=231440 RepID=A0A1M7XXJ9_9BACT|nr:hypothetical protein SAMN02745220_00464 [Desulfopila aestuarii DSM 18488]